MVCLVVGPIAKQHHILAINNIYKFPSIVPWQYNQDMAAIILTGYI